ncbi:MAG: hypothetical protein EBS29_13625, partial [Chloroflexia bacterium]|nr:hypothetical protein [Chloroflexia bacterium]
MTKQRVWQPEYWGFALIALVSWLVIYASLATMTSQAAVDVTDRDAVVGIWAPESDGAWSNGDTHITIPYFAEFPWRSVAIKWRRPLDTTITATL